MRSRLSVAAALAVFAVLPGSSDFALGRESDAQIRQAIINQSIAAYRLVRLSIQLRPEWFELWRPQCL